jgi:cytochrome bd-type quinol oxidase subunit 2
MIETVPQTSPKRYADQAAHARYAAYSLTVFNSKTGDYSMRVGLVWWLVGIILAIGYFVFLYRFFRGKVTLEDTEGY